jgi:hypothetical protein
MSYAILQGNSTDRNKILKTQKKIIRIMAGIKKVPLLWYYLGGIIYLCLQKVVLYWGTVICCGKLAKFWRISDVHSSSTCLGYVHMPDPNLPEYQKGVYCTSIILISNIPYRVQSLNNNIKHSGRFPFVTSVLLMILQQLKILQLYEDMCYFLN